MVFILREDDIILEEGINKTDKFTALQIKLYSYCGNKSKLSNDLEMYLTSLIKQFYLINHNISN